MQPTSLIWYTLQMIEKYIIIILFHINLYENFFAIDRFRSNCFLNVNQYLYKNKERRVTYIDFSDFISSVVNDVQLFLHGNLCKYMMIQNETVFITLLI